MKDETYDIIVIGSGLGGLICANILSREGFSVLVLEKNNQLGGNLQTFVRNKKIFDTGVHYIGGLAPGQNLYRYFNYLEIMNDLKLERMDQDAFDEIYFGDIGPKQTFPYGQGKENYIRRLSAHFPQEEENIRKFVGKMEACCHAFPLFNLDADRTYDQDHFSLRQSVDEVIATCTDDPLLRAVLAGTNLLYAGERGRTPFYVHALSVFSYLESAWKCTQGGSQIALLLARQIRKHGGKILKYKEVVEIEVTEDDVAVSVRTRHGDRFQGKQFISNTSPKQTLQLLGDHPIRKSYRRRINQKEETISSFSLFLVLEAKTVKYRNQNMYYHRDIDSVWEAIHYEPSGSETQADWPANFMLSMTMDPKNPEWAESITVFTYMDHREVQPWTTSKNTVAEEKQRADSYQQFKEEKSNQLLAEVAKTLPGIHHHVRASYASTPLTYRDYIGNAYGELYGFSKSIEQPLTNLLPPRTKIKNLLLTGQYLNMHGILGVTISAFMTCSEILGQKYLLDKVNLSS